MSERQLTLRFLAEPIDMNYFGNVHGGTVMRWIDQAGSACAVGWSSRDCVTVYVGGIRFYRPIHINDLVELRARVIYTGHTSMHVAVDVCAGNPRDGEYHKTTHCIIVFVALDSDGKPVEVPKWTPETEEDIALETYARKLMDLRKGIEVEMDRYITE
jgi:acyl-CoA hydrolase